MQKLHLRAGLRTPRCDKCSGGLIGRLGVTSAHAFSLAGEMWRSELLRARALMAHLRSAVVRTQLLHSNLLTQGFKK